MIRQRFEIPRIGWRVYVFYAVDALDTGVIERQLRAIGCENTDRVCRGIGEPNSGVTYTNTASRASVVVIGLTTSADEFANTYDHEKGHLVRHISQHLGLEPYGEQEQYIAGYVSQQMFSVAKSFLCDHCRKDNTTLANFIRVFL